MYKVSEVSKIAGISARTIRYYDEIDLLKPSVVSDNGYRLYVDSDLDKLQQILLYKNLGLSLYDITRTVNDENFDLQKSLLETLEKYKSQKEQIDGIIKNIEDSLLDLRGEIIMDKKEKFEKIQKFEEYKQQLLDDNEKNYGDEMRQNNETYDPEMVKYSNNKVKNMNKEEFEEITSLDNEIKTLLEEHVKDEKFDAEIAKKIYDKHKAWLFFYWGKYNKEAHIGVSEMYVSDERFKKYYDKNIDGCAEYLRECIAFCAS